MFNTSVPPMTPQMGPSMPMQPGMVNMPPPAASPLMNKQPQQGQDMQGEVFVTHAKKLLEQALLMFGSGSPKGREILNVIKTLNTKIGESHE